MNISDYVAKAMEEKLKKQSKDAIRKKEETKSEDRELVSKFYKALASQDKGQFREVNDLVAKDYKAKAQTVGTSSQGGLLVPTTVRQSILTKMRFISPMRQIATVLNDMPANFVIPSENALPTTYWVSEGAAITESGVTFDSQSMTPFKLAGLDSFTSEVLEDAAVIPELQNYVEDRFAISMALKENDAFVNGDGSGKPFGFRSSAITPTSVTGNTAAGNLAYGNLVSLKYGLGIAYRALGTYVTSGTGVQLLEKIVDTAGRPIYRESITDDVPATLLGRPVVVIDEIPANLGAGTNETELWFGLFNNYWIGDRGALRVDYGTNADDFSRDKISLRMVKRVAGRPVLGEAFAKMNIK